MSVSSIPDLEIQHCCTDSYVIAPSSVRLESFAVHGLRFGHVTQAEPGAGPRPPCLPPSRPSTSGGIILNVNDEPKRQTASATA